MLSRKLLIVAVALIATALNGEAQAVTTSWIANSGSFTAPANWSSGVPDSDDTAIFNRGFVAYEVNFPGGSIFDPPLVYPIQFLRVNTNEVGFVYTPVPFQSSPSLSVVDPGLSIVVGENSGDVSILNMAIAGLSGADASIGRAAGANGTLNVGGAFNLSGTLNVGESGTGAMNVTGGRTVASANGFIGSNAGSNGQVTVSGANSQWVNSNFLIVGSSGSGALTIQDGGSISSDNGLIGSDDGSNGTMTVTGAASTWTNGGDLEVGSIGTGTLTIAAGGGVSDQDGTIGAHSGSNGTVTVTGAGSTWTNSGSLLIGGFGFFGFGTGMLTIEAGGSVSNVGVGTIFGSNSTATVTGAGSNWTNSGNLSIGTGGTLTIEAGGSVANQDGAIAPFSTVTVTGAGSTWTNSGDLTIGENDGASGTLIVSDGGAVSVGGQLTVELTGSAAGNGTLSADVVNRGIVSPGLSPGVLMGVSPGALDVDGNYVQSAGGKLQLRLGGTTPGSDYDQLQVSGAVTLNGTLSVALANSFVPSAGDVFDILDWTSLSGTFDAIMLPALSADLVWNTSQLYLSGVLIVTIPGDYNGDGTVDTADYVLWRKDPAAFGGDPAGYNTWRTNFGRQIGAGSGFAASPRGVPEPECSLLVCLALAGRLARGRSVFRPRRSFRRR
jgi:T5SS/PEP-CTERM-associated repeat protein